jgi:AcrR family transcriptional regulator
MGQRLGRSERRAQLLEAALAEFALHGLHLTTAAVAARAGVSQPYLFRFFPTKQAMVCEAVERCFDLSLAAMRSALAGRAGDVEQRLGAMGSAYALLLRDSTLLQAQLQAFAAARDPEIRSVVRRRFARMRAELRRLADAPPAVAEMFLAHGMLLTIARAAGARGISPRPAWADHLGPLCALLAAPTRKRAPR